MSAPLKRQGLKFVKDSPFKASETELLMYFVIFFMVENVPTLYLGTCFILKSRNILQIP